MAEEQDKGSESLTKRKGRKMVNRINKLAEGEYRNKSI